MLQFIASMERMAAQSHWTGSNRFGSFAPIRLNVSAQWLADGVCPSRRVREIPRVVDGLYSVTTSGT